MDIPKCIDVSNYDGVSESAFECLKSSGVERLIIGTQRPEISIKQYKIWTSLGGGVRGLYNYYYWGYDVDREISKCFMVLDAIGGIPRVWHDCEEQGELPGVTVQHRQEQLAYIVDRHAKEGITQGIYTGKYFWQSQMGNMTNYSRLPLWHASYYNNRSIQEFVDYGGWTKVAIHQYASSPPLCGRDRDYNHEFMQETEEEDMTPEQIKQLQDVWSAVCGQIQGDLDEWNRTGQSLILSNKQHRAGHATGEISIIPQHSHHLPSYTGEVREV